MPLIEGFGDEVTLLLFALLAGIIIILAWMSTQVDSRFLVPIIILDRERFSALMQRLRGIAEQRFASGEQLHDGIESSSNEDNQNANEDEVTSRFSPSSLSSTATQDVGASSLQESSAAESKLESPSVFASGNCEPLHVGKESNSPGNESAEMRVPSSASAHANQPPSSQQSVTRPPDQTEADEVSAVGNQDTSQRLEDNEDTSNVPEGHIRIRLQYVDGRQRLVYANPDDTVREFKRNNFSSELAERSVVRFVMSGQELRNDDSTLRSYRVSNGSVIHCLITQARMESVISSVDSHHFEIGFLLLPLFGFILTLLWYARIVYRSYFSGASTFSLVAISFLYLIALVGSFRSHRINHPHHD